MKKQLLVLLFMIFSLSNVCAQEVINSEHTPAIQKASPMLSLLSEEHVEKAQADVAHEIQWREWKKRAAYCAIAGFIVYNVYDLYTSIRQPTIPVSEHLAVLKGVSEGKPVTITQPTWGEWLSSGSTWKGIGKWIALSLGSSAIGSIGYSFLNSHTEPSVIAWYVSKIAPTEALIHGMYAHAEKIINTKPEDKTSADFHYTAIIHEHQMLTEQLTKTLGFMLHKAESMASRRKGYAHAMVRQFVSDFNRMTQELERLIVNKYAGIGRVIAELDMEIQRACAQFARIEQSPWVDASQMQGLVLAHILKS